MLIRIINYKDDVQRGYSYCLAASLRRARDSALAGGSRLNDSGTGGRHSLAVAECAGVGGDLLVAGEIFPDRLSAGLGGLCLLLQDLDPLTVAGPDFDEGAPGLAVFHQEAGSLVSLGHVPLRHDGGGG